MDRAGLRFAIMTVAIYLFVRSGDQAKSTPQDVIKKYERYVREMRADSVVQLFTSDAEIGHEGQSSIKGRDSIYRLLVSLTNVKVIRNRDSVSNVFIKDDSAVVNGNYNQTVVISGKDTVSGSWAIYLKYDIRSKQRLAYLENAHEIQLTKTAKLPD